MLAMALVACLIVTILVRFVPLLFKSLQVEGRGGIFYLLGFIDGLDHSFTSLEDPFA